MIKTVKYVSNSLVSLFKEKKISFSNLVRIFKTIPLAEIYLYVLVFLYPILPTYFVLFGARVYTILALGALLLLFTTPQIKNVSLSIPKVIIIFVIFACYLVPSIYNGELLSTGYLSFVCNYLIIPIYFAVQIDSYEKFDRCINVLLISALIVGALSLTELFGFNIFSLIETVDLGSIGSVTGKRFGVYRIESSFGQAIAYNIYLSFMICLVFYKLFKKENQRPEKQNIYLIYLLFLNALMVFAGSRFPLMVVLLAQIVLFFKLNRRSKIKVGAFALIFIIVTVLLAVFYKGSLVTDIINNIINIFSGDKRPSSENPFAYRGALFNYAKKVIGNDYIFGRGLHVNQNFFIISPNHALFESSSFDNGYISLFLQVGIVGVIGWIVFCYSILTIGILNYSEKNKNIVIPVLTILAISGINMFSVARLDETRAFMVIMGCFLGTDLYLNEPVVNKKDPLIKKVLFIRTNDLSFDSRAQKEIESLSKIEGIQIDVLGWNRDGQNDKSVAKLNKPTINGVHNMYLVNIFAPWGRGNSNMIPLIKFMFTIKKWLKSNIGNYDLIHCVDLPTALFSIPLAKSYDVKTIYDIYDYFADLKKYPRIIRSAIVSKDNKLIKQADAVIICTEDRKKQLGNVTYNRLEVIHNSPDVDYDFKITKNTSSNIKFCYVGNLVEERMIKLIVDYIKAKKDFTLEIGGVGNLSEYVNNASLECKNIHYHGKMDYQDVLNLENTCDIMFALYDPSIPNHKYIAPNKFYESLYLGKQLIAIKNTGLDYYFNKYPIGELIEPNIQSLDNAVEKMIKDRSNWYKNALIKRKLFNNEFSWKIMENKLISLYQDLLMETKND